MIEALAHELDKDFVCLTPGERLRLLRTALPGQLVFTTSLGIEDQVLTHLIAENDLDIQIITLDTGRLFPESHDLLRETERRYGRRITVLVPDAHGLDALITEQGLDGFRHSIGARQDCCAIRKLEPLGRALAAASGWITGLRADQSMHRSAANFVAHDRRRNLLKANPLLDWTREQMVAFAVERNIPVNALHARGFLSIGCAPCTRAVKPGEPERAGRWWWENEAQKECGLHVAADGKLLRATAAEEATP